MAFKIGDRVRLRKDKDLSGHCCGYKESQTAGTVYTVTKASFTYSVGGVYFNINANGVSYCNTQTDPGYYELVKKTIFVVKG